MENYIIIAIVVVIVGAAIGYVIKAKKNGAKCIGCSCCSDKKENSSYGCCCGCGDAHEKE